MSDFEIVAVQKLKDHLATAKWYGYPKERMIFCDGFLAALCAATGKNYGFSDGEVYIKDANGNLQWV